MGLPARRKRVILPMYKVTDHTPSVYNDPFSNRLIPVGYFLNNLDEIGPAHWNNPQSADYSLKIIKPQEVDYFLRSNWIINQNMTQQQYGSENEWQENLLDCQTLPVACSDEFCSAADAAALTIYFNAAMINYKQIMSHSIQRYDDQVNNVMPSPPSSPIVDSHNSPSDDDSATNISNLSIQKISPSSGSPPDYYFHIHTLILATQSGYFNQLFGPINLHSSSSQLPNTLFVPIPYPECFGTILHWLYHHDDDAWLDDITEENFEKFYWNIRFLKLGKEAYDVLDEWIDERLEDGISFD
ncbi:36062_t:CDS:2, partial [Racocetra persica]